MLKVTGDGKKLALDPRCIDPLLSDESGSKLNFCADNVYEEWKNSADIKGTQLVFCDLSTPKKPYSEYEYGKDFDAYNDLKHKLIERGIPENEIAFIHDANTDRAKQDLFDKINAGAVRVLIGSTEKCGAGTNVQKRLVAIHHLDAPYRPRDLIQRNGRGIRQGNMNKGIRIYTYATERTFDSYAVRLSDNSGEEKKTAELTAKDFCEFVRGKDESAYGTEYKRPSEEAKTAFAEREKALRAAVPDEMKKRPNWVVVKTWWNAEKVKYNKRPVNCNSDKGEYAESDNPKTWTTFDNALKYLKEKGGTTVAYALDGKDNISCIDLDRCYDENGQQTALTKEVLSKCGKTYVEMSVSGNGLHIFGKTSGMDIRTFSKDGDLEFYQRDHFIAMTGDGTGYSSLESFDTPEMKELLSRKCEKREEWKGVCKGVNGLSTMTDRDVVEKASNAKNGDKFKRLYAGEDLQNNHSNSDMSLMNLLAYWCNGDKEQMLRIFATSGLFRPNKSPDYYEGTAIKALRSMPVKSTYMPTIPKNTGGNGKR